MDYNFFYEEVGQEMWVRKLSTGFPDPLYSKTKVKRFLDKDENKVFYWKDLLQTPGEIFDYCSPQNPKTLKTFNDYNYQCVLNQDKKVWFTKREIQELTGFTQSSVESIISRGFSFKVYYFGNKIYKNMREIRKEFVCGSKKAKEMCKLIEIKVLKGSHETKL